MKTAKCQSSEKLSVVKYLVSFDFFLTFANVNEVKKGWKNLEKLNVTK